MTILDEPPRRYGEFRYRYLGGTLAQIRQTQTFVREDEDEATFEADVLTWCARFDLTRQPDEHVQLVKVYHDDKLTRVTIIVEPDEPSPTSLLHALERILKRITDLADRVPRRRK